VVARAALLEARAVQGEAIPAAPREVATLILGDLEAFTQVLRERLAFGRMNISARRNVKGDKYRLQTPAHSLDTCVAVKLGP
jgi:hypothetical protein